MVIVVDASIVVKVFVAEPDSADAVVALRKVEIRVAPDLILLEAANALSKIWRRGIISAEQMDFSLGRLPAFIPTLYPTRDLIADAAVLSRTLRHPVPDCIYAVLASRLDTPMLTADAAFAKALARDPAWRHLVILLRDFDRA